MFLLTDRLLFGEGRGGEGLFKIEHPKSSRWKNFGRRRTRGMGRLQNWTMDIIRVSSLTEGYLEPGGKSTMELFCKNT